MKPISFRLRIALLSALLSGAVLVGFGATAWYLMYRERLAAVDREIHALAQRHPGWAGGGPNYERWSGAIASVFGEEHPERLILLLKGAADRTRFVSSHWPAELDPEALDLRLDDAPGTHTAVGGERGFPGGLRERLGGSRRGAPRVEGSETGGIAGPGMGRRQAGGPGAPLTFNKMPRFLSVTAAGTTWRIGILGNNGERLVLGLNLDEMRTELSRLRNGFLMVLPLALLMIGGGGWWIAGRAVRPLRSIAQVAERVTAQGLDQRLPPSGEDTEIAKLVRVLNRMMDRLEASFHQATRFSADASHELRTPLAVMQGELENALQSAPPGSPAQQVYANLLEETQRLKSITHSLLLLAQADAGQMPLALTRMNLSDALTDLREDIDALAAGARLSVTFDVTPDLWVRADWNVLRQAILNLLHNGLRYNAPDGRIGVTLASRKGQVELEIWNDGPGIPLADQPRLFDRFFRTDTARERGTNGVGLGLSLAREIVRAHEGALLLKESRPGRTCFVVSLPDGQTNTPVARPFTPRHRP
jgi:two-component system, OmpR family, heavy metal sensor histidine kinase CusS